MKVETRRVSRRLWRILALRPLDNPIYSILYILSINNCATLNRTIFIRLSLMFTNLLSFSCKMEWRFDVFASLRTDGQWGFDELCEWSILFRARHRPFSFTALLGTFPLGSGFPYWKKQMTVSYFQFFFSFSIIAVLFVLPERRMKAQWSIFAKTIQLKKQLRGAECGRDQLMCTDASRIAPS